MNYEGQNDHQFIFFFFFFQNYDQFVPPCAELCEKAKDGCVASMHANGIEWPEAFECSQYPSIKDPNVVCLPEPEQKQNIYSALASSLKSSNF